MMNMENKTKICELDCFNDGKCLDTPKCAKGVDVCCYCCEGRYLCDGICDFLNDVPKLLNYIEEKDKELIKSEWKYCCYCQKENLLNDLENLLKHYKK